ncbi:MAG: queuosine precursor transporter [Bacteroidia bacterium]
MLEQTSQRKKEHLFLVLGMIFLTNAIVAEFIGAKIFSLEKTLGFGPSNIHLLGGTFNFDMTAGVILWPIVFILTDLINEYYGKKGVQKLSWIAAGLLVYAFIAVRFAMWLQGADFWLGSGQNQGLNNMSDAFNAVFGQGLMIILGSLVAFLVGQIVDATIFTKLKEKTGDRFIWIRATGSTLVSQFIDSYIVLVIAFYLGGKYDLVWVLQVGTINYVYKLGMAICLLPLLYGVHRVIDRYLGIKQKPA